MRKNATPPLRTPTCSPIPHPSISCSINSAIPRSRVMSLQAVSTRQARHLMRADGNLRSMNATIVERFNTHWTEIHDGRNGSSTAANSSTSKTSSEKGDVGKIQHASRLPASAVTWMGGRVTGKAMIPNALWGDGRHLHWSSAPVSINSSALAEGGETCFGSSRRPRQHRENPGSPLCASRVAISSSKTRQAAHSLAIL